MARTLSYLPQALRVYAAGVVPGQEALGIQPFGEPPLLPDWSDDPFVLGNAAATYVPGWNDLTTSDSSALEDGMLSSLAMLEDRSGARAVLVATDAETTSYGEQRTDVAQAPGRRPAGVHGAHRRARASR